MSKAYIAAAAMTRFGKYPQYSAAQLGRQAIAKLLDETGLAPKEIDAAYFGRSFSGTLDGQIAVPGQAALHGLSIDDIPVFNIDNACAAGPTALHLAVQAVRSQQAEITLVVGMDKLFAEDRKRSMRTLFGAMDVDAMSWLGKTIDGDGAAGSIFMDTYYARIARAYLTDTSANVRDFAKVAVKNRVHASCNPFAQYRQSIDEDEVMASPMVADPLRTLMCSPLTDGAAAMIVCSQHACGRFHSTAVEVLATAIRGGKPKRDAYEPALTRAARQAYAEASLGPGDLDLVEVHDASAVAELIATEELGLAAAGDGARLVRDGDSRIGGRRPVNPSGGLLSRGHPGAATGASQIVELVWQLQGRSGGRQIEGARIGLAHSSGGVIGDEPAATVVTILART